MSPDARALAVAGHVETLIGEWARVGDEIAAAAGTPDEADGMLQAAFGEVSRAFWNRGIPARCKARVGQAGEPAAGETN